MRLAPGVGWGPEIQESGLTSGETRIPNRIIPDMEPVEPRTSWTFVTQHARILAMILGDPEIRLRDLAENCRLTERAAQAIVTDLETAGYLTRVRHGRRNHYEVTPGTLFRHPAEGHHEIADLLQLLVDLDQPTPRPTADDHRKHSDGSAHPEPRTPPPGPPDLPSRQRRDRP